MLPDLRFLRRDYLESGQNGVFMSWFLLLWGITFVTALVQYVLLICVFYAVDVDILGRLNCQVS